MHCERPFHAICMRNGDALQAMLGVSGRREARLDAGRPSRIRLIGARALTVVAILLALVGMLGFYLEHTVLDEEGFESISREMIENDEIRTQVAATTVERLFANVDVEAAIAERLPPAAARVGAGPRRSRALGCRPGSAGGARATACAGAVGGDDDRDAAPARTSPGRETEFIQVEAGPSSSTCAL